MSGRSWFLPGPRLKLSMAVRLTWSKSGQRAVVAHGGRGGHGNKRFATSTRQAPRFAENGTSGEEGWIELQLKLLADVGLIGLPNAGKSSLLGRLTRAAPKVADYPFTTLSPVLGTIEGEDRQAIVADIPGLIEGAAEGAGLGHEFLAHVERCAMLVHLVELEPLEGDPVANYEAVREELSPTGLGSTGCRSCSCSRSGTCCRPRTSRRRWRSGESGWATPALACSPLSSATGEGLEELRETHPLRVAGAARDGPARVGAASQPAEFEVEHRVYRPAGEGGYSVEREDDGAYPGHRPRRRAALRAPRHQERRSARLSRAATQRDRRRSPPCAPPASSPATRSASASTSSSSTPERRAPPPKTRSRAATAARFGRWHSSPLGREVSARANGRWARSGGRRRRRRLGVRWMPSQSRFSWPRGHRAQSTAVVWGQWRAASASASLDSSCQETGAWSLIRKSSPTLWSPCAAPPFHRRRAGRCCPTG